MKRRIWTVFTIVALTGLFVEGTVLYGLRNHYTRTLIEAATSQLRGDLITLRDELSVLEGPERTNVFERMAPRVVTGQTARVYLLDGESMPLMGWDGQKLEPRPDLPRVPELSHPSTGPPIRDRPGRLTVVVPISTGGSVTGYLLGMLSRPAILSPRGALDEWLIWGGGVIYLVFLGGVVGGLWWFHRPLEAVGSALRRGLRRGGSFDDRSIPPPELWGPRLNEMFETLHDRLEREQRRNRRMADILNAMDAAVIAVDGRDRITYINQSAESILDPSVEPVQGRRIWEIAREEEIAESLDRVRETNQPMEREYRELREQDERIISLHAIPLNDGDRSGGDGVLFTLRDVSELRRLQTIRRDFIANVSHELKTPLTAMQGLVETLLDDGEMDPEIRDRFLSKLNSQVTHLTSLVGDLLTLSRLESREESLNTEPVDVRDPVRESVELLESSAESKGQSLRMELPDDPVIVEGNRGALSQLFNNLIDNAIKYTPEQGSVTVRVERSDHRTGVIEVRDTGKGIGPREQERIFERFYRGDKNRTRSEGGTGLGLSIVKHIVRSMDGDIDVQSVPGTGSTFRVILPLIEQKEGQS